MGTTTYSVVIPDPYLKKFRDYPNCYGVQDVVEFSSTNCWKIHSATSLTRESRPYPTTPLIYNLTSRGLQTRYTKVNAFCSKKYTVLVNCPGDAGVPATYVDGYFAVPTESYYDVPADPDWQNAFRAKCADMFFNAAENIGEYREACSMFVDSADYLVDLWKDFRRYKLQLWKYRQFIRPKDVASAELFVRYGVKPLITDLEEVTVKLAAASSRPLKRRITSFAVERTRKDIPSPTGPGRIVGLCKKSVRTVAYIRIDPGRWTINPGTPAEALWASLPFSFVFDYFIDVGSWLQQMDALRGISLIGGTNTFKVKGRVISEHVGSPWNQLDRPGTYNYDSHSRSVITSVPLPKLQWKPSGSYQRVKAMTEILVSHSKGGRPPR